MRRREPSWDELRTFFEVVRYGSLSSAARRLGLTQPTVGRHIDALEERVAASHGIMANSVAALGRADPVRHASNGCNPLSLVIDPLICPGNVSSRTFGSSERRVLVAD